jgi:hypothetical protein
MQLGHALVFYAPLAALWGVSEPYGYPRPKSVSIQMTQNPDRLRKLRKRIRDETEARDMTTLSSHPEWTRSRQAKHHCCRRSPNLVCSAPTVAAAPLGGVAR